MRGRPVRCRANLSTKRLASVAVIANCQRGSPNRRPSSSATQIASSDGSIVVMPFVARSAMAAETAGRACPVMAPVSPRHRSTYSIPSTSVNRAPLAESTNNGNEPAQRVIHGIGTPASSGPSARSARAAERGWVSTNLRSSATRRSASRPRSIMTGP